MGKYKISTKDLRKSPRRIKNEHYPKDQSDNDQGKDKNQLTPWEVRFLRK